MVPDKDNRPKKTIRENISFFYPRRQVQSSFKTELVTKNKLNVLNKEEQGIRQAKEGCCI